MFSIKSRKCQEPPRTDKSQTPTNADLQSTYYSTLSTKLDTPRRTLPTIRGRRCSRRMAHSDIGNPPTPSLDGGARRVERSGKTYPKTSKTFPKPFPRRPPLPPTLPEILLKFALDPKCLELSSFLVFFSHLKNHQKNAFLKTPPKT